MENENPIIIVESVSKSFKIGKRRVKVLKDIDLKIEEGELAIIFGPSGCGKSTLLHTLLGMEDPDDGKVFLADKCLYYQTEDERAVWRWEHVGIVFQQSNWIKSLSVWENVGYPLMLTEMIEAEIKQKALACLEKVGMAAMADKKPMDLSGGEQQRVSLARALVTEPKLIVADEPTGNLDSANSKKLIGLLTQLNKESGKTVVMGTHDDNFLPLATHKIFMSDGKITGEERL